MPLQKKRKKKKTAYKKTGSVTQIVNVNVASKPEKKKRKKRASGSGGGDASHSPCDVVRNTTTFGADSGSHARCRCERPAVWEQHVQVSRDDGRGAV